MTTSEIAIVISVASVSIAGFSLGWNIYRDVILKAKVVIDFSIGQLFQPDSSHQSDYINISAVNHGPGLVKLSTVKMKDSSWWRWLLRKEKYGFVIHDYRNPLSGQLPHKLEVGENFQLLFPYEEDCFLKNGWSHVGITDYFGRTHWAQSKQIKKAIKQWNEDFTNHT